MDDVITLLSFRRSVPQIHHPAAVQAYTMLKAGALACGVAR